MAQPEDKYVGELTSFHCMVASPDRTQRFDNILIPKIQRDYAQGRPGREVMRERFLKRLFRAVDSEEATEIKLDFVYGQKKGNSFLPIDGQQRLTTLFLLHLYVGKRCGESVDALRAFTYDTRDSSKEFCLKLIDIPGSSFSGIRKFIEDQWWYTSRWSSDPTISSMVVMLDDIDRHYRGWSDDEMRPVWKRLVESGNIKFWNLTLDDLKTADDLYIKMNSRGKPLTNFEHFKAEIESYIYDRKNEASKVKAAAFSLKIDTVWTYMLWAYRDTDADSDPVKYGDNGLDDMFVNIFRRFMIIEGTKAGLKYNDLEREHILSLSESILKSSPSLLDRFTRIMDFFASLPDIGNFFSNLLTEECDEYRIEKKVAATAGNYRVYIQQPLDGTVDFLLRAAKYDYMNNANMLMLEAFFHFAAGAYGHGEIDASGLREKLRIIRNLILNSRDELRADKMCALLLRVDGIMDGVGLDDTVSGEFRQMQVRQEIDKIGYILAHPQHEWDIKFAENHSVLRGNLSCYMSGAAVDVNNLLKHGQLFHANADYELVERFLLTFGDYAPEVNGRLLYGGRYWWNWRDDIFNHGNKMTAPVLCSALSSSSVFDDASIEKAISAWLSQCVRTSCFPWRYYLVAHRGARHGESARYTKAADFKSYDYIMMNRNNFNGKHWNPFLFCLLKKMEDTGAKLADYGAPLIFEKEEISVRADESSFEVTLKNGRHVVLPVPQRASGGIMIDCVDRVEWGEQRLRRILDGDLSEL